MKCSRTILKSVTAFSCIFFFLFSATGDSSKVPSPRQFFAQAMNTEAAQRAFQIIQVNAVNTPDDARFHQFFYSHPLLRPLVNEVRSFQDQNLNQFSQHMNLSAVKLVSGMTPRYDRIDRVIVEVAQDLGFSPKAIENREVYIQKGDVNAFAVSGNHEKIVIGLQSDLLEKMTRSEVRAVMAHELGHVLSKHTRSSFIHQVFLNILNYKMTTYMQSRNGPAEVIVSEAPDQLPPSTISEVFSHMLPTMSMTGSSPEHQALINRFTRVLAELSEEQLDPLVNNYLEILVATMQATKAPRDATEFYQAQLAGAEALEKFDFEPMLFQEFQSDAFTATMRSAESSADRYATSTVPNTHMASAIAKLLGLDFEPEHRQVIFDQIQKQAAETNVEAFTSTHPPLAIRLTTILNEPNYPGILFANPFLKLVLLEDALRFDINQNKHFLSQLSQRESNFAESYRKLWYDIKEGEKFHQALQEYILQVVLQLDLDNPANPRFDNLLDYVSLTKISLLKLAAAEDEGDEVLQSNLAKPSELLAKLKAALKDKMASTKAKDKKLLKARLAWVRAVQKGKSVEQIEKARKNVQKLKFDQAYRKSPPKLSMTLDPNECFLLLTAPETKEN